MNHAGCADAGQYFTGDPFGEFACLGFAAAQDEGVEAGFVDQQQTTATL